MVMYCACARMAGTAIKPTAEKPVKNLPASIHLTHERLSRVARTEQRLQR
jgi:hypothetical protein